MSGLVSTLNIPPGPSFASCPLRAGRKNADSTVCHTLSPFLDRRLRKWAFMPTKAKPSKEGFIARLTEDFPDLVPKAEGLIGWSREQRGAVRKWTTASKHDSLMVSLRLGVVDYKLLTLETAGRLWILYGELADSLGGDRQWQDRFIGELRRRLSGVPGQISDRSGGTKQAWSLARVDVLEFTETLDWMCGELTLYHARLLKRFGRTSEA